MRKYYNRRVGAIYDALHNLRYALSDQALMNAIYAELSSPRHRDMGLDFVDAHTSPFATENIRRILKEDLTIQNSHPFGVKVYLQNSTDPTTVAEFFETLEVLTEPTQRSYSSIMRPDVSVSAANANAFLSNYDWNGFIPEGIVYRSFGEISIQVNLDPNLELPLDLERYRDQFSSTFLLTDVASHSDMTDRRRTLFLALNDNGELFHPPASVDRMVNFYGPENGANRPNGLMSHQQIINGLQTIRRNHRSEILGRLRAWRTNEEEQARMHEAREAARIASEQRFAAFRAEQEKQVREANRDSFGQMVIPTLPFVESGKGIKASRRWGIEVETGAGRDLSEVPEQWDSKGDGSLESAYGDSEVYTDPSDCYYAAYHDIESMTQIDYIESEGGEAREVEVISDQYRSPVDCDDCGWRYSYDGDDDDCIELVSPILNSMHSRGLKSICNDLEHAPVTDTAGVHVHVEAKDLTVRQVQELVMGYDHIERFIESSYDRTERGYCKRRSPSELLSIVRQDPNTNDLYSMRKGDRYVTVNLLSLSHHGTIEFRAMGPKYNYDHLIRWAMFCREFVNAFANGATSKHFAKAKTWEDVVNILVKFGTELAWIKGQEMGSAVDEAFEALEATV